MGKKALSNNNKHICFTNCFCFLFCVVSKCLQCSRKLLASCSYLVFIDILSIRQITYEHRNDNSPAGLFQHTNTHTPTSKKASCFCQYQTYSQWMLSVMDCPRCLWMQNIDLLGYLLALWCFYLNL